ncbi:uncharacterized protein LOC129605649 [Condylostylus longicornis]|uniref:uncharacterized protein LOC129605649 n=1 Tax=Condylostylus longicornis TaxID=2530218 RepID=UPI00244DFF0B|nr:uncharacterized protein LOC129605649 [Condylostylus longicornis]
MNNLTENDVIDSTRLLLKSLPILISHDKKPLNILFRSIKHLPQNEVRDYFLNYIKLEYEKLNKECDEKLRKEKEKNILLYVLSEAYERKDLDVFKETLSVDKSVAFLNKKKSIFNKLWEKEKYDEFFSVLLGQVKKFEYHFSIILNRKFNENNTEEICILLHDKIMSDYDEVISSRELSYIENMTLQNNINNIEFYKSFITEKETLLINLLNGLAVSDVHEIRTKAELGSLIYKVNQLYSYEENYRFISKCNWLLKLIPKPKRTHFASRIYLHTNTGYVTHFPLTAYSEKDVTYLKEDFFRVSPEFML